MLAYQRAGHPCSVGSHARWPWWIAPIKPADHDILPEGDFLRRQLICRVTEGKRAPLPVHELRGHAPVGVVDDDARGMLP